MVERVPARPVHESDVGQLQGAPVVRNRLAPVEEEVADAGAGDEVRDGVPPLRERRQRDRHDADSVVAHRAVAVGEAAAGKTDLSEERGERHRREDRLFSVFGTLQRIGHVHQRPPGRRAAREVADRRGRDPAHGFRPLRRLRHAVGLTTEVGADPVGADRVRGEERLVGEPLRHQRVGEGQEHRRVGSGPDADPLGIPLGQGVVPLGRHRDDARRRGRLARQARPHVTVVAARHHPGVGPAKSAERDHEVGVLGDVPPRRRTVA